MWLALSFPSNPAVDGGSRGAQSYTSVDIDEDIAVAEILNTTVTNALPDRTFGDYINFAEFNVKDSTRPGENFPLQFAFEAATCRIFYTQHTVYNYLNLWDYVVDAIWRNPSLCINGSANGTTILPTNSTGPLKNGKQDVTTDDQNIAYLILTGLSSGSQNTTEPLSVPQSQTQKQKRKQNRNTPTPTTPHQALSSIHLSSEQADGLVNVGCGASTWPGGQICASVPAPAGGGATAKQCVRTCPKTGGGGCRSGQSCIRGQGICLGASQAKLLKTKSTPTRSIRAQVSAPVGDGNAAGNFAYSKFVARGGSGRFGG